eukprot:67051_1
MSSSKTTAQSSSTSADAEQTSVRAMKAASRQRDRKKGAKYHCDYCRKDITSVVRIKCAECKDFDLCVECFSVGVQVPPHVNTHKYRVIDHVTEPIFREDWGADEELLLLEGIEMFGLGNWADVADHVGTKSKQKCENHFISVYLESKSSPLPMPLLPEKTDKGKEKSKSMEDEKSNESDESVSSAEKTDEKSSGKEEVRAGKEEVRPGKDKHFVCIPGKEEVHLQEFVPMVEPAAAKGASPDDDFPMEGSRVPKGYYPSLEISRPPKPIELKREQIHPSLLSQAGMVGFIPERGDFDNEYDNDAEHVMADMEFKDSDTEYESALKLRVLKIYNIKLEERRKRKDFIIERGIAHMKDKKKTREEREIYNNMKMFARFHSQEQHDKFLKGLYNEQRLRQRIQQLQNQRLNGIRSIAEGEIYEQERKKRQVQLSSRRTRDVSYAPQQKSTHIKRRISAQRREEILKKSKKDPLDISKMENVEKLNMPEKKLCEMMHFTPKEFLEIKDAIAKETYVKGMLQKGKTKQLITVDVSKSKNVLDFFISTGWPTGESQDEKSMESARSSTASGDVDTKSDGIAVQNDPDAMDTSA